MIRNFGFRRSPALAITFDTTVAKDNSVALIHDFAGPTNDFTFRVDGAQVMDFRYNPIDTLHYGFAVLPTNATYALTFTDQTGRLRSASATTPAARTRPSVSRTRYVSPTGSGTTYSAGVPGDLSVALTTESAGDRIICQAGTYYVGDRFINTSLIMEADTAATVIIRGFRETQPSSWSSEGGGRWSTTDFDTTCRLVCFVESAVNQQLAWREDTTELDAASHGWTITGSELHVKLPGGLDPNSETMRISDSFKDAFTVFADDVWIEDIIVEGFGAGSGTTSQGFICANDRTTFVNVTVRDNLSEGIRLSTANDGIIDGCTFEMHRDYMSFDDIKNLTTQKYESEQAAGVSIINCTGAIVRNCTFSEQMDAITMITSPTHVDIHDNTFTKCFGETISADTTVQNVARWANTLNGATYFVGYAAAEVGPNYILNDVGINIGQLTDIDAAAPAALILQGTKFNSGSNSTSGMLVMYNCTLDATAHTSLAHTDGRTISIENGFEMGRLIAENNIFAGFGHPYWDENATGLVEMDHNTHWTSNDYGHTTQLWRWRSSTYAPDFAGFQSDSGQETNGAFADPVLVAGYPTTPIPSVAIPGVTSNALIGATDAVRGAQ